MTRPSLAERMRAMLAPAPQAAPAQVPCPRPPPTGEAIARRIGVVRISIRCWHEIRDCGEGMNLLDQMVVIRVENVIESAHVLLVVMHPEFDRITPGMVYPEYEATFIPHNPFPIWRKV